MYFLTYLKEAFQNSFNQVSKTLEPLTVPVAKEISETTSALGNFGKSLQAGLQVVKSSALSLINGAQSAWNFFGGVVNDCKGATKDVFGYGANPSEKSYEAAKTSFSSAQKYFETSIKDIVNVRDALVLAWKEGSEAVSHAKNAANFGLQALSEAPAVAKELYYLAAGGIKKEDQSNKVGIIRTATQRLAGMS